MYFADRTGAPYPLPMLGRDRDFSRRGVPLLCWRYSPRQQRCGRYGAQRRRLSSSITHSPLFSLGRKVAIADAAGAAQALFHSRLENGLDFPLVSATYHSFITSRKMDIISKPLAVSRLSFAAIKRTWYSSKVRFKSPTSTTSRPILLWSLIMTVATFPARISSSIASSPGRLKVVPPHSVIGEVPDIRKAVLWA